MKRLLALLLLVLVTGCSPAPGTADWDQIEATFDAGSTQGQTGNYTVVVTPTEATYEVDGKPGSRELREGVWALLTTGVRALGDRSSEPCPGGEFISITATSDGVAKQTFQASSCDAGDTLDQAKALIDQVLQRVQ